MEEINELIKKYSPEEDKKRVIIPFEDAIKARIIAFFKLKNFNSYQL